MRSGDVWQRQTRQVAVPEFEHAWGQPEDRAVGADIAEFGEGEQEPAGRRAGEFGGAGDIAQRPARVLRVERIDDAPSYRRRGRRGRAVLLCGDHQRRGDDAGEVGAAVPSGEGLAARGVALIGGAANHCDVPCYECRIALRQFGSEPSSDDGVGDRRDAVGANCADVHITVSVRIRSG